MFLIVGEVVLSEDGSAPQRCDPDLDGDGVVNQLDLDLLELVWGLPAGFADLDDGGAIGTHDLGILIAAWGLCGCAPGWHSRRVAAASETGTAESG
ncbi:MAG TPA: hypothetical protein PKC43_14665 [Phycisphaerales bacterium]|nr:hypothetical protein [Phycisphaerales bacterium]HMP38677.1 hypothetical protein [Phycisphaerales bacterium]